jgi:hypothetical protein
LTHVGYPLYREIRDYAPGDWSSSELVVALMIADDANDDTRASWIPTPLLCARARLKASSVRAALTKLAARGYEFRVIHGYARDGRPVFAVKGRALDFVVPDMIQGARIPAPNPVDNPDGRRQDSSAYSGAKALGIGSKALGIGPVGAGIPAPLSSDLLSISSTEESSAVTGPVESAPATPDQEHHHHQPWPAGMHWVSPIEQAARQAAEARTIRTRNGGPP